MTLTFTPTEVTVDELRSRHVGKRLNLEPPFQRQSVWTHRDRTRLAESILEGFPIPAIFFHVQPGHGGKVTYDVIDGKQRIESILAFMNHKEFDHWDYIHPRISDADGRQRLTSWKDMSSTERHEFLKYRIQAIEVTGDLSDVIDLFVRINSTGRRLKPAEARHARYYSSALLQTATRLAHDWGRQLAIWGVITSAQRQRMKDIELMTELLLAAVSQGPTHKKRALDNALRSERLDSRSARTARSDVQAALTALSGILPNLKATRFRRITDFYSLVVVLMLLRGEGQVVTRADSARNQLAGSLLTQFSTEVDRVSELAKSMRATSTADAAYVAYLRTVKEGTDSLDQRARRQKILRDVLGEVFEQKDRRRSFNATQRRLVWNASVDHRCGSCRTVLTSIDQMHVDHVKPHSRGGRTTLSNAQLLCARCNREKGAR